MELDWFTRNPIQDADPALEQEEILCSCVPSPDYRLHGSIQRGHWNGRSYHVLLGAVQDLKGGRGRQATLLVQDCCFWTEAVSILKTAMAQHEDPASVKVWQPVRKTA